MTDSVCPCDTPPDRPLVIPAGLSSLPRQTQLFPDVRQALLEEIRFKQALDAWRARGSRDFGVMWLELWAYVADVLGFYDERIANESYIRTAVRRPSLRRIVDLLGYIPAPGIAGETRLAAIAEGRTTVQVPARTGFRSDAFDNQPPQVFETETGVEIHPLKNSWEIESVLRVGSNGITTDELTFETAEFGLAKDRIVLITLPGIGPDNTSPDSPQPFVTRVTDVAPFEGKDGTTYVRVTLQHSITIPTNTRLSEIKVQTPSVSAVLTANLPPGGQDTIFNQDSATTVAFFDTVYRQLRQNDRVAVARQSRGIYAAPVATALFETLATIPGTGVSSDQAPVLIPIAQVQLSPALELQGGPFDAFFKEEFTFHFGHVDAGRITNIAETDIKREDLGRTGGVGIVGVVERPPEALASGRLELETGFLLRDADERGALVDGVILFNVDGSATFQATDMTSLPPDLRCPITVFGNVIRATRGESVNEVLGNGNARLALQRFKLRKKPLTYLFVEGGVRSTLEVRVDGVLWSETKTFFGATPEDRVYIVRHDDDRNTFITFGDGVRGARLPSGIKNVLATYRFGSGSAVPPPSKIRQLARPAKGLRGVESPLAATAGKDPDEPAALRSTAPKSVLLFGRAVSTDDFGVLANLVPGVIKAIAEFAWIDDEQQAGVVVRYIGTPDPKKFVASLRAQADPTLPIRALQAQPIVPDTATIEVEVEAGFDAAVVADAVKAALIHVDTGPFALKNAPIGGVILTSTIFEVIHAVPGVIGVRSIQIPFGFTIIGPDGTVVSSVPFFGDVGASICVPPGHFLDFEGGRRVNVVPVAPNAPGAESAGG
jgi:hypothetical protein